MTLVRRATFAAALAATLVACQGNRAPGATGKPAPVADLVIYGRVWTGDSARPWAAAVAVAGDTIAAVGDSSAVAAWQGTGRKSVKTGAA
jgi:hypothetical protein